MWITLWNLCISPYEKRKYIYAQNNGIKFSGLLSEFNQLYKKIKKQNFKKKYAILHDDTCGGDTASTWVLKLWEHSGDGMRTSLKTYHCNWQRLRTSSLIAARSTRLWLRIWIERHLATKIAG